MIAADMAKSKLTIPPAVADAISSVRSHLWAILLFSSAVNLLIIAGPLYMLQVYDRVLPSRSLPTLAMLSLLLVVAYLYQLFFDILRTRLIIRVSSLLDHRLAEPVYRSMQTQYNRHSTAVQDLGELRQFLTSAGLLAVADLPWIPIYIVLCYFIHPVLAIVSIVGGGMLFFVALLAERNCRTRVTELGRASQERNILLESIRRNLDSVRAMGMSSTVGARWLKSHYAYLATSNASSEAIGAYTSVSKMLRLLIQSAILGIGAVLVIENQMSAGSIIAASILMGRALSPVETLLPHWRSFVSARESLKRLSEAIPSVTERATQILPPPRSTLEVADLKVVSQNRKDPVLSGISFRVEAGQAVGVIGASGSGKTTLARAIVAACAYEGDVRLDGATHCQWDPDILGRHIGFLPQNIELFPGTIAENISRMEVSPNAEEVLAAARLVGIHEMIIAMPEGYDTVLGADGFPLSAGQKQRIALARAVYGNPFLVVLDEPQSNLDTDGDRALAATITTLKARGSIVVMVSHRPSSFAVCDKILYLSFGRQLYFGARDEVVKQFVRSANAPATRTAAGLSEARSGSDR